MLTFEFTGVEGRMTESEVLTSGMVGKAVRILFDDSWASLSRTVVFRAGEICRVAVDAGETVIIPEDVLLRPFRRLFVGVYGTDSAGTLVTPTIMAEGPMIRYGADPTEDSTAEDLPVWKKLLDLIGDPALLETDAKENLVAAINEIHALLQIPCQEERGLSETAAGLLIQILRHAVYETDQSDNIDALKAELLGPDEPGDSGESGEPEAPDVPEVPEVTLSRITVSYTGGSVPVGTAVTALTGITVTAYYSDGSSRHISGYTLSGNIRAGDNTVTVSYQGQSAAFTVVGTGVVITEITAAYAGGEVPAGTALRDLTGITVTAYYSDGSSQEVTDYSLTGTVAAGSNTITVIYHSKTATFSVTGFALPERTLTGIVAEYNGDVLIVGTPVTALLTKVIVMAEYSDGSSESVTGFTLSGELANVGNNTITVSYAGMSATFTVPASAAEITLSHISAEYTGGPVAVGTNVNDLSGLVVRIHYSDGNSTTVSSYTLSGTIGEGNNTITVTWGSQTTTFVVVGVAESANEPTLLYSWDYTKSLTDTVAGQEMRILGATQDAEGLHINNEADRAYTGVNVHGKTVEIEFGDITDATGTRAIMLGSADDVTSSTYSNGLCWHGSCWAWYQSGWNDKNNTNILAFANSTLVIPFKADGSACDITINGQFFMNRSTSTQAKYLGFGSNKTSFRKMTIKKLKIYEGA